MVTELNLGAAGLEIMSWTDRKDGPQPASKEQRPHGSVDCAAMARMPLPALLYYVLVGDGRINRFG